MLFALSGQLGPTESDPIADMVIVGVMEEFDELHSLMSKEKGLAGMAENVRQGFRAGGRAPKGYQLVKIPTGTIREGEAVTKSRLEPSAGYQSQHRTEWEVRSWLEPTE